MRLVYLSPVPWSSFAQRPHKFAEWFHNKTGNEILWVDPYPGRLPNKRDFRRAVVDVENKKELVKKVVTPEWLTVLKPSALPIEPLPLSGLINGLLWRKISHTIDTFIGRGECVVGIGKPSEMALQILAKHSSVPSFYDAMDNFPSVHSGISRRAMARREQQIADKVPHILVSSTALLERYEPYQSKTTFVLNACAVEELPPVLQHEQFVKTVFGYVGTISHWFDWSLVCALATANPSACIRLIGPVLAPASQALPDNVEVLAACSHADAIKAMHGFSVGIIPFKKTELTDSVDPVKYYEYRALGLPVLTTDFGEMRLRDAEPGVYFMDENTDLSVRADEAAVFRFTIEEIQAFRDTNSWTHRFDGSGFEI